MNTLNIAVYFLSIRRQVLYVLQVYSLQQGRRDVETVLTMGIMEDVNIVPQAAPGGNILKALVSFTMPRTFQCNLTLFNQILVWLI